MTALQRLLALTEDLREKEEALRLYYEDVWELGEILFSEGKTTKQRKTLLRKLRQGWEEELQRIEEQPERKAVRRFFAEACRLTDDQWEGLFHCYSNPKIPNTNNGTEQLIAELKNQQRQLARNPSPGARFIRNAPTAALFVNQKNLPGAEFIGSSTPEQMAEVRDRLRHSSRQAGVARLARRDLPLLTSRIKARWRNTSIAPPTNPTMAESPKSAP